MQQEQHFVMKNVWRLVDVTITNQIALLGILFCIFSYDSVLFHVV